MERGSFPDLLFLHTHLALKILQETNIIEKIFRFTHRRYH